MEKENGDVSGNEAAKIEHKPLLEVGTRLIYLVKVSEKVRFNLEAEITMTTPELRFSFYMNNMDFTFGAVHVSRNAIENASAIRLMFEDGLTELAEESALIASKKTYEDIVTRRKTFLRVNSSEKEWFYLVENEECPIELDGINFRVPCMLLRNEDENLELKICRNVTQPAVLYARTKDGTIIELLQWHNPPRQKPKDELF